MGFWGFGVLGRRFAKGAAVLSDPFPILVSLSLPPIVATVLVVEITLALVRRIDDDTRIWISLLAPPIFILLALISLFFATRGLLTTALSTAGCLTLIALAATIIAVAEFTDVSSNIFLISFFAIPAALILMPLMFKPFRRRVETWAAFIHGALMLFAICQAGIGSLFIAIEFAGPFESHLALMLALAPVLAMLLVCPTYLRMFTRDAFDPKD